jgi:CheY-like chemotaxis protein
MAKVVFVEDDLAIQKLIRVALRQSEHEVLIAGDGAEGLELIRRERPDVIFTDIAMPGMNGLELCATLRSDAELADIPVVVVTASVQRANLDAISEHGATDYLAKPFEMDALRSKIEQYAR